MCQSNLETKGKNWRYHAPWFQIILQTYNNQNSTALAQRQTHISMEQKRQPRNESTHLWSINLWQKRQEYENGKKTGQWCWENWTATCKKNEIRTGPHTIYKNKLKMDLGLNVRLEAIKFLEENIGRTHLTKITIFFNLKKRQK